MRTIFSLLGLANQTVPPMRTTFHGIRNIEEGEARRRSARLAAVRIRQMTKQQDKDIKDSPCVPTLRTFTVGERVCLKTHGQEQEKEY